LSGRARAVGVVRVTPSKPNKAVFLDRDGTLIEDAHYLADPAGVVVLPGVRDALARLRQHGFLLFILTNQSGVGRGRFDLAAVERCHQRMIELLDLPAPLFTRIGVAPEAPDQPVVYRKPSPRFIDECVASYELDRRACWMVGDKLTDVETGRNAGIASALIGNAEDVELPAEVPRFASLWDFAQAVTGSRPS
jgi:D-glycero-D-manno-heptose 1,7-bisphosphate phosphatase